MKHLLFQFATVYIALFLTLFIYIAVAILMALFDMLNTQSAIVLGCIAFAHYLGASLRYMFASSK